jgi:hypothetical protein
MTGRPARGVRLVGAIDKAGEQHGFARERLWETHREMLDDALRAMGARGAALYDSGRKLSIGQAMVLAMDGASDDTPPGVTLLAGNAKSRTWCAKA